MRARQLLASGVLLALVAAACGNSSSDGTSQTSRGPGTAPQTTATQSDLTKFVPSREKGVDDSNKEIRVAVVTSKTNPIGGKYAQYADGVKAYFKTINDKGGIYGR